MSQRDVADLIKKTHLHLRCQFQGKSPQEQELAWQQHASQDGPRYALAMKTLAQQHWDHHPDQSRNLWIKQCLDKFFVQNDRHRVLVRLQKKLLHVQPPSEAIGFPQPDDLAGQQISVLDIGSCFNPLKSCCDQRRFRITALDLNPAADSDVLQCDFLQVALLKESSGSDLVATDPSGRVVSHIRESSFDVVVLSLVLEYLPVARFRYRMCEKAHAVLRQLGLLIIITPDSCHEGRNQRQMHSWHLGLALMGFQRVYMDKLTHLRCLAFLKVHCPPLQLQLIQRISSKLAIAAQDLSTSEEARHLLFSIPQDSGTARQRAAQTEVIEEEVKTAAEPFEAFLQCMHLKEDETPD